MTGTEEEQNIYRKFSPDFFDLIVVDECHRGSAADDSAWRDILDYFSNAKASRRSASICGVPAVVLLLAGKQRRAMC